MVTLPPRDPRLALTPPPRPANRGAVLVVVLAVTALIAAIAAEIAFMTRMEGERVSAARDGARAEFLALSAYEAALSALREDADDVDSLRDDWNRPIEIAAADGTARATIRDESARFPLNELLTDQGLLNVGWKTRFERLAAAMELPRELPDCLVDYMDADDNTFPNGAEADEYALLSPPRRPANRPLLTTGELARVKGLDETRAVLLGGLVSTVSNRVNVNTAEPLVLLSILPGLTPADADRIAARRRFAPFEKLEDLNDVVPLDERRREELLAAASVASSLYRIEAAGKSGAVEVRLTAIVARQQGDFTVKYREVF